jgi:hypothetical protein
MTSGGHDVKPNFMVFPFRARTSKKATAALPEKYLRHAAAHAADTPPEDPGSTPDTAAPGIGVARGSRFFFSGGHLRLPRGSAPLTRVSGATLAA